MALLGRVKWLGRKHPSLAQAIVLDGVGEILRDNPLCPGKQAGGAVWGLTEFLGSVQ